MPARQQGNPEEVRPATPGSRDRSNSKGAATRQLILETAERLFAERGIEAVPLRDIAVAAGQRNNVAVQYHFGDRETLIKAIVSYRAAHSEQIRTEMLADLLAADRPPQARDLVRAFVVSLTGHLAEDNHYLAFLSRHIIERGGYTGLEGVAGSSIVPTFLALLARLLPEHPQAVLHERWMTIMTTTAHTLSRYQTAQRTGELPAALPDLIDDLVSFLAAGLESTVTRPAAR
ncbi:TetR/AcrR family transcriptional regulator [Nocardia sp. alder85J]|uniref:TetR/AcrR family transcriptional regulator n=1 Tax=Nocardia sp. alder85J TaxID=2862949 RepID=UPI001CD7EDBD|nr:TetR/AcrR family transcriptional regulator [Nocardia sp. alder85J]MCX4094592.1 TetR family transcriptional regulator [Nocardia sp. alder85J]